MNELHDICPQSPMQKAIHDLVRAMDKELVDTVREKGVEWVIAALRAQQSGGWISVEDRLPDRPCEVIIWVKNAGMWLGYYNNLQEYQCWMKGLGERVNGVTHWQYLPAPPEPKEG